jgi:hypothetical protein
MCVNVCILQFLGKEKEMTYMSWCSLRLLRYLFSSSTRSLWVLIPSRFSRSLSCMFQVVGLAVCMKDSYSVAWPKDGHVVVQNIKVMVDDWCR